MSRISPGDLSGLMWAYTGTGNLVWSPSVVRAGTGNSQVLLHYTVLDSAGMAQGPHH